MSPTGKRRLVAVAAGTDQERSAICALLSGVPDFTTCVHVTHRIAEPDVILVYGRVWPSQLGEADMAKHKVLCCCGTIDTLSLSAVVSRESFGILKFPSVVEKIVTAIRAVSDGAIFVESEYKHLITGRNGSPAPDGRLRFAKLTPREIEVLRLRSLGLCYKEIASSLHVAQSTINNHLANVRCKVGVTNSIEALRAVFPTLSD